jgi:hypothetical protein
MFHVLEYSAKRLPTLRYLAIGFAFYLFNVLIIMDIFVSFFAALTFYQCNSNVGDE